MCIYEHMFLIYVSKYIYIYVCVKNFVKVFELYDPNKINWLKTHRDRHV
jgi:hypothetical protein